MDLDTFIVSTYCLIDDLLGEVLQERTLRSARPQAHPRRSGGPNHRSGR